MTREILFKARRSDNGEWITGDVGYNRNTGAARIWTRSNRFTAGCPVDPETVCQYTGIKDFYDRKMFDGDEYITQKGTIRTIYYSEEEAIFKGKSNDGHTYADGEFEPYFDHKIPEQRFITDRGILLTGRNIHDPE